MFRVFFLIKSGKLHFICRFASLLINVELFIESYIKYHSSCKMRIEDKIY